MKQHHILGLAVGYLALGAAWVFASEHILPPTIQAPPPMAPPGGITGQLVLWPWGAVSYVYAKLTEGSASAAGAAAPS